MLRYKWYPYFSPTKRLDRPENSKQKLSFSKQGRKEIDEFLKNCSNTISMKVPFIKPLQRKLKTFVIYRMMARNGTAIKEFRRVNLDGFKSFYNDPNIIGFTPNYIGFRKSRMIKISSETLSAMLETKHICRKYALNVCQDPREVHSGSPDSNSLHLRQFLNRNRSLISTEKLIKLANLAPSWFKYADCDFSDPREMIYATNFNPKAYPGHMTSRLLQSKNKGTTVQSSIILAMSLYNTVRKIPCMNNTLWDIFAREKDMKVSVDKEISTRVVLVTEEYVMHLVSWVIQKILSSSQNHESCKFHIRGEYDGKKAYNIHKKLSKFDYYLDADWSFFDSTIDTEYLEAACMLFFTPSIHDKETMRLMFFITCSIIYKNVIIPPGVVVRIDRGNPSGHPCVTAINCVVNCLRWANIGKSIYGENYADFMDIEVYGDDAIVMFKSHANLCNLDEYCKLHGYPSDPLTKNLFPTIDALIDVENAPDFLKRKLTSNGLIWNRDKLIQKLIYPSRSRDVTEQISVILDFIGTAPCDNDMNDYLFIVIDKMLSNCKIIYKDKVIEEVNVFKKKLESIKYRYRVNSNNDLEGLDYESNITSESVAIYIPRFESDKFYKFNFEILSALNLQVHSIDFLNMKLEDLKDFKIMTDIRENCYYNFKFPKEFLIGLITRASYITESKFTTCYR